MRVMVDQILRNCSIYNNLRNMCLIENKEIEIISEIYRRARKIKMIQWAKVDKVQG